MCWYYAANKTSRYTKYKVVLSPPEPGVRLPRLCNHRPEIGRARPRVWPGQNMGHVCHYLAQPNTKQNITLFISCYHAQVWALASKDCNLHTQTSNITSYLYSKDILISDTSDSMWYGAFEDGAGAWCWCMVLVLVHFASSNCDLAVSRVSSLIFCSLLLSSVSSLAPS